MIRNRQGCRRPCILCGDGISRLRVSGAIRATLAKRHSPRANAVGARTPWVRGRWVVPNGGRWRAGGASIRCPLRARDCGVPMGPQQVCTHIVAREAARGVPQALPKPARGRFRLSAAMAGSASRATRRRWRRRRRGPKPPPPPPTVLPTVPPTVASPQRCATLHTHAPRSERALRRGGAGARAARAASPPCAQGRAHAARARAQAEQPAVGAGVRALDGLDRAAAPMGSSPERPPGQGANTSHCRPRRRGPRGRSRRRATRA